VSHDAVYVDAGIFRKVNENKNVTFAKKVDSQLHWNTQRDGKMVKAGNETQVHVYSRKNRERTGHLETKFGQKWNDTDFAPMYKTNTNFSKGINATYTEAEQGVDPHADKTFDRYSKAAGDHSSIRSMIEKDAFNVDYVNDVSTFTPNKRKMLGRSRI
jgi:hypothetical protein